METHIGLWQCGGGLDGPCAAAEEVRKVFVLAARCRGPMGDGGLESAGKAVVASVMVGAEVVLSKRFSDI